MKYRREIDGLRALAVVPVILFHAGIGHFGGGFVGVDIFFVISGYLITSIVIAELEAKTFSIVDFYERRARRILPALYLVLAVCLPFAWFWLLPADMKGFARSLAAVAAFSSNMLFWQESGYFDLAAESKPLLHTWSLGVEEQFYLLFPLFLAAIWRWGKTRIVILLMVLAVLSLGLAQWAALNKPTAAFYLLPTRAWELTLGALAAIYLFRRPDESLASVARQLLCGAGLGLILFGIFMYSKATPFPGLYALAPTVGTLLIILFASPATWVGNLLGSNLLVGTGLISYSAYLWHQPIFAFARHRNVDDSDTAFFVAASAAAFLLAYLTWRFVEKPFRNRGLVTRSRIFLLSLVGCVTFLSLGMVGSYQNGFAARYPAELTESVAFRWEEYAREKECNLPEPPSTRREQLCYATTGNVVALWGDSHAAALYPGLASAVNRTPGWGLTQVTQAGCGPIFELPTLLSKPACNAINDEILAGLLRSPPRVLVIHAAWVHPHYPLTGADFLSKTTKTLSKIKETLAGTRIIVIGPVPRWRRSPQEDALLDFKMGRLPADSSSSVRRQNAIKLIDVDELLRSVSGRVGLEYVSPLQVLCNAEGCISKTGPASTDWISIDSGHLSKSGAEYLMGKIDEVARITDTGHGSSTAPGRIVAKAVSGSLPGEI